MVSLDLVQKNLIKMLQSDANLMTALSNDINKILEMDYQGQDFTYPNVRLDVQLQNPVGNGTDRTRLSTIHWTTRVYSDKPYSQEANHILGLVMEAQFNKQWVGTDENGVPNFYLIRINLSNSDAALRIANKLWIATAVFESQINLKTAP